MNRGIRRGVGLDAFWPHNNASGSLATGTVPQFDRTAEGMIGWGGTSAYVFPFGLQVNGPVNNNGSILNSAFGGSISAENAALGLCFIGTQGGGGSCTIDLRSYGGSFSAPTITTSGTSIGGMHIGASTTNGGSSPTLIDCAHYLCVATQDFSTSQSGCQWQFHTTQNGTNTKTQAFTIDQDGSVTVAATGMTNVVSRTEMKIAPSGATQTYATGATIIRTLMKWDGTDTWQVNPFLQTFGGLSLSGTIRNDPAFTMTWAAGNGVASGPTVVVDTQTGVDVKTWTMFSAAGAFNIANSGTYTAGIYKGFSSAPVINGVGSTLTSATHFIVTDTSGSNAALTNQFGIDIPALAKAGTSNIAIRTVPPIVYTPTVCTCTSNAATVPVNIAHAKITNSSAATCTITLSTTGALDGQELRVRFLDATAASQTVTFSGSETGKAGAPPVSLGSTTIPTTYRFIFNNATTKWTYCSE